MQNEPCEGAVVQVVQIDSGNRTRCLLGYAVTDEYGEYVFALEANPWMIYELSIFSPLI